MIANAIGVNHDFTLQTNCKLRFQFAYRDSRYAILADGCISGLKLSDYATGRKCIITLCGILSNYRVTICGRFVLWVPQIDWIQKYLYGYFKAMTGRY